MGSLEVAFVFEACTEDMDGGVAIYLLSIDNIHDHTTLEHACKTGFDRELALRITVYVGGAIGAVPVAVAIYTVSDWKISCHCGDWLWGCGRCDGGALCC